MRLKGNSDEMINQHIEELQALKNMWHYWNTFINKCKYVKERGSTSMRRIYENLPGENLTEMSDISLCR